MNAKEKAKLAKQKLEYVQWLLTVRKMSTVELLDEAMYYGDTYYNDEWDNRKRDFIVNRLRLRIEALERRKR